MLLTVGRLIPLRLGIIEPTTIVSTGSGSTTYICEQFIAELRKKALPLSRKATNRPECSLGIHGRPDD